MGILLLPDGRTQITHSYRRSGGKHPQRVQVTIDSQDKRQIAKAQLDLIASVEGSFSDIKFKALSAKYREDHGDGGMRSVYEIVESKIGNCKIDKFFPARFDAMISELRGIGRAENTVSNYKSVVQRVLNSARSKGIISEVPISDFSIRRTFRDRVWRGDERQRFMRTVSDFDSHLQWAIKLAECRPIRGDSDLVSLTSENLVLVGPNAPYIRFRPAKTGKRKPRDTYLPLLDKRTGKPFDRELFDYLVSGRPAGCPLLFPAIGTLRNRNTSLLKIGAWRPLGDFDRHWNYLCEKAEVTDLHFHDLKHVAITRMLRDEGWSRDDLKGLGIQYSDRAIDVYYNSDAESILGKACSRNVVAEIPDANVFYRGILG
jgi:integrase